MLGVLDVGPSGGDAISNGRGWQMAVVARHQLAQKRAVLL
jgi:hypothetical protein